MGYRFPTLESYMDMKTFLMIYLRTFDNYIQILNKIDCANKTWRRLDCKV